jgi:hypothetical protein
MNAAEITDKLGLHSLRQRAWYIQAACATSGDGLYEGLEWVSYFQQALWLVADVSFPPTSRSEDSRWFPYKRFGILSPSYLFPPLFDLKIE